MPNTHVPAAGEAMPIADPTIIGRFSRRALLGAIAAIPAMATTATFAAAVPTPPADHPDTELFRLDQEMAEAHAKMERASNVQDEVNRQCEESYPPEPPQWVEPKMSDQLREFIRLHPLSEGLGERAEYHKARAEKRAAWKATQEAYLAKVEAINRAGGLYPADEAYDATVEALWDIGDRIFATPAYTLEGIVIKLRAADRKGEPYFNAEDGDAIPSIVADIRRIATFGATS